MSDLGVFMSNGLKKQENHKNHFSRDVMLGGGDLWTDGLICAFEFVRSRKKTTTVQSKSGAHHLLVEMPEKQVSTYDPTDYNLSKSPPIIDSEVSVKDMLDDHNLKPGGREEALPRSYWVPIGWGRISELVRSVQVDAGCWEPIDFFQDEEDDVTVADLAAPYWEGPVGPTWWCHVAAAHPFVNAWLRNAQWIHPAICIALRDESKLISERMKHLLYEVPVRVAGGLLFELLGQSAGDPLVDEDDIPIVLRSWQAQNFLVTALHVKGSASNINVLGITEVQELLAAGGNNIPRTIHEVIAHLASRLARWDDRLFRKSIFGAADAVELKFMNRRNQEDVHLFSIILNQEIRRLSTQVIRVKWSLHAREEIVFELLQHLRGNLSRVLLERIRKTTREMIQEQEAVRGRLFTIQDVMQSTVRSWLQDRSLTVTHNLGVLGGCGLILSIITGLFGINVDGIPGNVRSPYAFALFSGILFLLGIVLIAIGLVYLGLKKPVKDENVEVKKLQLEEFVRMFQQEAESHAQVRKTVPRTSIPPTATDQAGFDCDKEWPVGFQELTVPKERDLAMIETLGATIDHSPEIPNDDSVTIYASASLTQTGNLSTSYLSRYNSALWVIDSGASDHMTSISSLFNTYSPCSGNKKVRIANGSLSSIAGTGSVKISDTITLDFVLHVPNLSCNLLSVSKLSFD